MSGFFQEAPILGNQYAEDAILLAYLQRVMPKEILAEIESDLHSFGQRVTTDIQEFAMDAENHEPRLIPYDAWGRRIDEIQVSWGWSKLEAVAAQEGLIAIGYERKYGPWSRLYQFAKLYLFQPSSAIYTCPLAMADGAAKIIETYGNEELKQGAYQRLTSRHPDEFWISGQWMTERRGGSDVSGTETSAQFSDGIYKLYGTKWFCSAVTAQMAMTLARIEEPDGQMIPGNRGLSLFYVHLRDNLGRLNNILINRLKDKLGTKALPTAELELRGTTAKLIGEKGKGVKNIATLLNITRIHNANCAVANMRRSIALVCDYSLRREAFGKRLIDHPLHQETLASMQVEFTGALHLVFHIVGLLGKEECGQIDRAQAALLRLLTPIAKLYTGKQANMVVNEAIECLGGIGYIEDAGFPRIMRDTQVFSIWEGTTNILSLDVLRAMQKESAFPPFVEDIKQRLQDITHQELAAGKQRVLQALKDLQNFVIEAQQQEMDFLHTVARKFAYSLARTFIASLLLEHAQWSIAHNDNNAVIIAKRWCQSPLTFLFCPDRQHRNETKLLIVEKEE